MGQIIVHIENGGVVGVERRPTPLIDLGKGAKTFVDLLRKGEGPNPIKSAEEVSDFILALYFIEQSEGLSAEQRSTARQVLYSFDPTFDSIKFDRAFPSAAAGPGAVPGPINGAPGGAPLVFGVYDP